MASSVRIEINQDRTYKSSKTTRVNGACRQEVQQKPIWKASPESSESEVGSCRCIYQEEDKQPSNGERTVRSRRTSKAEEGDRGAVGVRFGLGTADELPCDASTSTVGAEIGDVQRERSSRRNSHCKPSVEQHVDEYDSNSLQANQKAGKVRGKPETIMPVGNAGVRLNRAASTTRSEVDSRNGREATDESGVRARSVSRTPQYANANTASQEQYLRDGAGRSGAAVRSRSANVQLANSRRQQSLDMQVPPAPEVFIPWQMQTTKSEPQFAFGEQRPFAGIKDGMSSLASSVLSVGSSASTSSVVLEVKKMALERRSFDDRFGFTVYRQKGHLVVASVDANSEAWFQGLRVGDRILKLNRVQAKDTSFVDAVQTIANSLRLVLYVASKRQPDCVPPPSITSIIPTVVCESSDDPVNYFKCVLASSNGYFGFALAKKRSAPTQIFVAIIDIPSPAHSAGLRENDVLVQVNGIDVSAMDYTHLIQTLRSSPCVALLVKRE